MVSAYWLRRTGPSSGRRLGGWGRPRRYGRYKRRTYRARRRVSRRVPYVPRRRYYRRRFPASRTLGSARTISFPESVWTKVRYADTGFTLTTSVGAPQDEHVFRGNSIYDPDLTGTGIYPFYYNEFLQLYARYMVVASKIKIWWHNTWSDSVQVPKIALMAEHAASAPTYKPNEMTTQPWCKIKAIQEGDFINNKRPCMKYYMHTRRIKPLRDISDLSSTMTTNPSQSWYWIFLLVNDGYTGNSSAITVSFDVEITYYTYFTKREEDFEDAL